MVIDKEKRGWSGWMIALPIVTVLITVVVYAVSIGNELGTMHRQLDINTARIEHLEQSGSGPVQTTTERVTGLQGRVDRMLDELLIMQKRMADLATKQESDAVVLNRLKHDFEHQ